MLHLQSTLQVTILNDINFITKIFEYTVRKEDAGKYMVKAVNDAGETQSIADFIILEATPERTVDIVNTVTVEKIEGQRVCILMSVYFE